MKYVNLSYFLKTVFSADFGFSEAMAIDLYKEAVDNAGKRGELKKELLEAFEDESVSWKEMLLNDEYEVMDLDSEDEARAYAKRVLWDPILG
ncbi:MULTISPECIES: hypothetical protein [unclassified Pseudomonas]|uniref:hypothetical protein n=1 Tax=unclassified Pseudomonas TaxID=196821 RepID=UPI0013770A2C|nr:hypothetical protein [Pseudomonas sp. Fl4BN1]NBF10931.1 hypothetical protein [Pseudomonas sp. Fl4BN1]